MVKVAENVYAVLGLFHPLGVNAGFIVTSDGVVVV
ncbi:MAG: MBL fold metallo-hydrolase, partial [Thermoprotei archaeon]